MAHLIDKDALVAEIGKLKSKLCPNFYEYDYDAAKVELLEKLENFLDTLDVKEVDLDNHTIMEEIRKCGCNPNEFDIAKHFYELGLKAKQG